MDLGVFDIVKKQIITTKSSHLFHNLGRVVFRVHTQANKLMIKKAVEEIWDVKVDSVRIINLPEKNKVFARRPFRTSAKKKAIVSLKKGYTIEVPGISGIADPRTEEVQSDEGTKK